MAKKVAFITGASRGIGAACAVELAAVGYDVALSARTVQDGEAYEHSATLKASDTSPLPGSLEATAAKVRDVGGDAMIVRADLLEPESLGVAITQVLERKGRIDVVVHNGRYIGPGHMDQFIDTPVELLRRHMEGNVFAPLIINKLVLPGMLDRGEGVIVDITSAAGYGDPTKPAGQGGWGLCYGMSKGAFQRIAGVLKTELGHRGIKAFNVQPGFVATERMGQDMAKFGFENNGAPPTVVGKVVAWLCTQKDAEKYNGLNVEAQFLCHELGLLPSWPGPPKVNNDPINLDMSGYNLKEMFRKHEEA